MIRKALFAFVICTSTLPGCNRARELQCPEPQLQSSNGDLKETAEDIRAYQDRFASGFPENAISDAIASLKMKYPDAQQDAIANYLTAAYCPNAIDPSVSLASQKAKLTAFQNAVHALLGD